MRLRKLLGALLASSLLAGCVMAAKPGKRSGAARTRAQRDAGLVLAELEQVTPASMSALALLSFRNTSERKLRVLRFRMTWEGGELMVRPPDLTLAAGMTLEAPVRVGPEAGDLDALYNAPLGVKVEVLAVVAAR